MHTLCEDSTIMLETLFRVLKELALDRNAVIVLLITNNRAETICLVLNKAPQLYYSLFDAKQSPLPLLLKRTKALIPVAVGTLQLALINDSDIPGSRTITKRKASYGGRNAKRPRIAYNKTSKRT